MAAKHSDMALYFIALVPEDPVYDEIWALKNEMRERYETKAALRSPPHVTLHMPFKWDEKKEATLTRVLTSVARQQRPFNLRLKDYGAFEPRVIYVDVEESPELRQLQKLIAKAAAAEWHIYPQSGSRPFRPHMTIAFRDLKKPKFYEAWSEFSNRHYQAEFDVSSICLLKHNGKTWDIYQNIDLSGKGD